MRGRFSLKLPLGILELFPRNLTRGSSQTRAAAVKRRRIDETTGGNYGVTATVPDFDLCHPWHSPGIAWVIVKISRSFNCTVRTQSTLVATWIPYEVWTREAGVLSGFRPQGRPYRPHSQNILETLPRWGKASVSC